MNSYVIILEHKVYFNFYRFFTYIESKNTLIQIVVMFNIMTWKNSKVRGKIVTICQIPMQLNMLSGMVEIILMFNIIT